jgi:hypothetical protein
LNGSRISNIRFADDVTLMSESKEELLKMWNEHKERSEEVDLIISLNKTKIMTNAKDDNFQIGNQKIEKVQIFKFHGVQVLFVNRENHEIWSYKRFFTEKNLALFFKRRLMDMCVLPVFTYG